MKKGDKIRLRGGAEGDRRRIRGGSRAGIGVGALSRCIYSFVLSFRLRGFTYKHRCHQSIPKVVVSRHPYLAKVNRLVTRVRAGLGCEKWLNQDVYQF